jgi:hypothetical protein
MQQQLFYSLRNAKQLNIRNLTKANGIHETKLEKIYETKRNFTFHETKRNEMKRNKISLFFVFRITSEISRNNFFVSLCFVFRKTKKMMRNGNPNHCPFSSSGLECFLYLVKIFFENLLLKKQHRLCLGYSIDRVGI